MKALTARIRRLEADRRPAPRVRSSVATFTPDGRLIGEMPKVPYMLVIDHGSEHAWQAALMAQQARLINEASEPLAEEGQGT